VKVRVTLGARIAATVAVAVLGSTVAVTYAAYELERTGTENRFIAAAQTGAAADVQQAANAIERQPKVSAVASVADFVQQRGGIEWLVIDTNNPDNSQGDGVDISNVPPPLMEIAFNGGFGQAWTSVNGTRKLAIGGRVGQSAVALVEYYDFGPVQDQLGRLRSDLIKVDVIGLLVALVLGVVVAAGISRPVRLTAAAARQLGGGALDTRVPVHGNSELGDLAVSFNDMAAQLSDAMHALQLAQTQQRQFVADVSHELRTPLAAMLAAAEGLGSADPDVRQRSGELVGEQTRRMGSLVENLLEISRFDAGQARLDLEQIDMDALVRDVIRTVAPDDDVQLMTLGDPTVQGDARRLHTILRNLVGNAVQHGGPPVRILVDGRADRVNRADRDGRVDRVDRVDLVTVTVTDGGPGIDPSIAPTLFDRFVRADTSRTARSGSTGLGLAIALENAQLHGATLTVVPDGTASFVLALHRTPPTVTRPEPLD
jgi:two-component system sensor histidine kinase MtrB